MIATTAADIISIVDEQYNNVMSNEYKIKKINQALVKLYGTIGEDAVVEIPTTAEIPFYVLPDSVEFSQITLLVVSTSAETSLTPGDSQQIEYFPVNITDELKPHCYFKNSHRVIGIYPKPSEDGQVIRIYHQSRADIITALDDILDIDEDYAEAISYYVMAKIAEANGDIALRNNFIISYDDEVMEAERKQYDKEGKYQATRDVRKMSSREKRATLMGRSFNNN